MKKIERVALRRELQTIEAELRPIKRVLGSAWTRPMADEQRRQRWLRLQATSICGALAFSRGRFHLRPAGWTEEQLLTWHREVTEQLAARYEERMAAVSP